MKDRRFSVILDDCLQRLDRGESLPDLLADFPELADQLKPLLLVAMASRAFPIPVPSQTAQRLGRNQMLAEMNSLEIKKAFRKKSTIPPTSRWIGGLVKAARSQGFNKLAYSYRLAMVSLVLVLSGGFFTITASASSQPGDLLYNLKLGLQRAGLTFLVDRDSSLEGEEPVQIPPDPWDFGQSVWALDDLYRGFQDPGYVSFTGDPEDFDPDTKDDLKAEEKALKELDKEAAEAEKEADKDLKDAEKEEEKDLKEEEKDEKEAEKDDEKDLKEDEKEEEKDEKEAAKEEADAIKELEKEDKKADKIEKE